MSYTLTQREIDNFRDQLPQDTRIITIEGLDKQGGFDVWDFVEHFCPDYHTSEGAALSNDLAKIIADDWKDSASCCKLMSEIEEEIQWTNGWLTHSSVIELAKKKQAIINASIFQDTIENFIQIMKRQ